MSNETTFQPACGLLAKIRQAVFGLPREAPPEFAHPWAAYHPARFKRDDVAASGINSAAVRAAIPSIGHSVLKADRTATDKEVMGKVAMIEPAKWSDGTVPQLRPAMNDTQPIKLLTGPPELKLIASDVIVEKAKREEPPKRQETPATDFLLAARLRSVSVLNRKVTAVAASTDRKRRSARVAIDNRPVKRPPTAKRRSRIEPPAIQRRAPVSAEIIYFKLALARAEVRQARAVKVG